MSQKHLLMLSALLLFLSQSHAYDLCDSVEYDLEQGLMTCNITETKYTFSQQSIDRFWENFEKDGSYAAGQLDTVKWHIKNATVQVADDVHFAMLPETKVDWDIRLQADGNSVHDINQSIASGVRKQTHATIRPQMGSIAEFLISFAPLGDRRTIRNLTLEKLAGGSSVYIDGSTLKKMKLDIEGDLTLSGSFIQNIADLKAEDLALDDAAYIENIQKIEAKNISMSGISAIRDVGKPSETALSVTGATGITLTENSEISNVLGKIEVTKDIVLSESSKIETMVLAKSNVIEGIKAKSISMADESWIKGIGSINGTVTLSGSLTADNGGGLYGRQGNEPKTLSAKSITLSNNATITSFKESIEVTGKETFTLESGAAIKNFAGTINTCAPISLDGNNTKIYFLPEGDRTIRAKSLDLNNGAEIGCFGVDCNYSFIERNCDATPTASLDTNSPTRGYAPLTVEFTGQCSAGGEPVTCEIDFGDGSEKESFSGTAAHAYEEPGDFKAILTATSSEGKTGKSQKRIMVREEGQTLPTKTLDVTLSSQAVQQGKNISLTIGCDTGFKSFKLENDLGMPTIAAPPESCPALLGPFSVPGNAATGSHSFTLTATTEEDETISQTIYFTVETGTTPGNLGNMLKLDLSNFTTIGIIGIVVLAIAAVVLIILLKKKGKSHTKPPAMIERKSEAQKKVKAGRKPPKEAEKKEETGWQKPDEKEAEALKEKIQKSAKKKPEKKQGFFDNLKSKLKIPKPAPVEKKATEEKPEKKGKGLEVEKGLVKKAAKEIEDHVEKKPPVQAQKAVEETLPEKSMPAEPKESQKQQEQKPEAEEKEAIPKKENIDILIEKLERVQAKKKGTVVPKAGTPEFVEKAKSSEPKTVQEKEQKTETTQKQAPDQSKPEEPQQTPKAKPEQPEEKPVEAGPEKQALPEESRPEPQPENETEKKQEQKKQGIFSRFKKKPAEKKEEEEELPPWLKKEGS